MVCSDLAFLPFDSYARLASAHAIPGVPFCVLTHTGPAYRFLWIPAMTFYLAVAAISLNKAYVMYVLKAAVPQFGMLNLVVEHTVANFVGCVAAASECASGRADAPHRMTTAYVVCCIIWLAAEVSAFSICLQARR